MHPDDEVLANRVSAIAPQVGELAEFVQSAFTYIYSDPQSSLTKSRIALERLLLTLYRQSLGAEPKRPMIGDMLADKAFTTPIPRRIVARMNAVRDMSNLGPHGEHVDTTDATRVLRDLVDVLQWYVLNFQPVATDVRTQRPSDSVELLQDLKTKYPTFLRPDLTSVKLVQSPDRCYLEMTTAEMLGGYLHNETVRREDLAFVSDRDGNLFDAWNSVIENARRFAFEMDPISIINCTDLFPPDVATRIDEVWRSTGRIPTDL